MANELTNNNNNNKSYNAIDCCCKSSSSSPSSSPSPSSPSSRLKLRLAASASFYSTSTAYLYFFVILIVLFGLANIHMAEATYRHHCPHQLPPGSWKGTCGDKLARQWQDVCRMKPAIMSRFKIHRKAVNTAHKNTTTGVVSSSSVANNSTVVDDQQQHSETAAASLRSKKQFNNNRFRRDAVMSQAHKQRKPSYSSPVSPKMQELIAEIMAFSSYHPIIASPLGVLRTGRNSGGSSSKYYSIPPSAWRSQNIICECCYNVCSQWELLEHCPD